MQARKSHYWRGRIYYTGKAKACLNTISKKKPPCCPWKNWFLGRVLGNKPASSEAYCLFGISGQTAAGPVQQFYVRQHAMSYVQKYLKRHKIFSQTLFKVF
jgi:hypothetical protein